MARRAGDGLGQHAALQVEDAGREVARLAHGGAEGGADHGLRLFLDHRDQAVPHDLPVETATALRCSCAALLRQVAGQPGPSPCGAKPGGTSVVVSASAISAGPARCWPGGQAPRGDQVIGGDPAAPARVSSVALALAARPWRRRRGSARAAAAPARACATVTRRSAISIGAAGDRRGRRAAVVRRRRRARSGSASAAVRCAPAPARRSRGPGRRSACRRRASPRRGGAPQPRPRPPPAPRRAARRAARSPPAGRTAAEALEATAHHLIGHRRAQEADAPSRRRRRPAPGCASTPIFSATRAPCSGPPPPKAIMVRPSQPLPLSTACTRAALAMFSSTISPTPSAAIVGGQAERLRRPRGQQRRAPAPAVRRSAPPAKPLGVDAAERQVGIGHRRPRAAAPVAGRARIGAGALRPDLDAAHAVDRRDASRRRRRSPPSRSPGCAAAGRSPS